MAVTDSHVRICSAKCASRKLAALWDDDFLLLITAEGAAFASSEMSFNKVMWIILRGREGVQMVWSRFRKVLNNSILSLSSSNKLGMAEETTGNMQYDDFLSDFF